MRRYRNGKGTAYRRGKNLQLTRKVKNSKTSEQIYSKNWPKYGGSLKACFVDADFDGVNDSVRSKYRSPALSKSGDPCHPVPDSSPKPVSGPTNLTASVLPPVSGPTNLTASVLPPVSGPTNLTASVLPPASGPSGIVAETLLEEPGVGFVSFKIQEMDGSQNSSYFANSAPNTNWRFQETNPAQISGALQEFNSKSQNRDFFNPALVGSNPVITTIANQHGIDFNGSDNVLHRTKMRGVDTSSFSGGVPTTTPNEGSLFLVIKAPATVSTGTILSLESHRKSGTAFEYFEPKIELRIQSVNANTNIGAIACFFENKNGNSWIGSGSISGNAYNILSIQYKFDDVDGFSRMRQNGDVIGSSTTLAAANPIASTSMVDYYLEDYIGARHSDLTNTFNNTANDFCKFTLFEYVEAPSPQTIADVEKIEGYLAHKWGLEGNLMANHAYKNVAPTF